MTWLNYHHLYYFWAVARTGSVTQASKELRLAHPTISSQIHRLEEVLGVKLFVRKGRHLALTEEGAATFRYASQIFTLGRELQDALAGRVADRQLVLTVGVSDVLAKSVVHRILQPAFELEEPIRVVCQEDTPHALLGALATHAVDVILADSPAPAGSVRTFNHPLGECGSSFFAAPALARSCRRSFPRSLDGVPMLLPNQDSTFRRMLDHWFEAQQIRPVIIAELDDLALASVFGEAGLGVLAAPDVLSAELQRRYGVQRIGRVAKLRQQFYAISVERKIKHPAVAAICQLARKHIFA